jgi:hypothetical protein
MITTIFLSLIIFFAIVGIIVGNHPYYKELRRDIRERENWVNNQRR